jgi:hypothetical protein
LLLLSFPRLALPLSWILFVLLLIVVILYDM